MYFRHISAKIQPKIWYFYIINFYQCEAIFLLGGGGPGPRAHPLDAPLQSNLAKVETYCKANVRLVLHTIETNRYIGSPILSADI